jgi:hypothetical protein
MPNGLWLLPIWLLSLLKWYTKFCVCQVPPSLAPIDALERYTQVSSHPLHKTNKPGILSIDIDHSKVISDITFTC